MIWPFGKPRLVPLFGGLDELRKAMREKDRDLSLRVGAMPINRAWREWRKVYPEDFPDGGSSLPGAHCIMPKTEPTKKAHASKIA